MKKDISFYVKEYSKDLTRLCISLCKTIPDAEDLFQDTWLKVMKNIDKYNDKLPFDKWLFTICVNTFKNRIELFENSRRYEFKTDDDKQAFFDSLPDDSSADPLQYLELHNAVMRLPKNLRAVIVLYYFRDQSVSDVSEIMGIPEGTVKSRLHSARQQIKRRLENE